MKVPLSWLNEHLDTSLSVEEISQALGRLGLVVDDIQNPGQIIQPFKIVEVLEATSHPNAERLKVCRVDTGAEILQVVCGDPKVRPGMKSVLGRPGDYVPGLNITLAQAKIRGIESQGMLCSLAELGLAEKSEGILDLPADAPIGVSYAFYKGLDDPILDIDVTPNRGDCLSMRGIARDLQAAGEGQLRLLSYQTPSSTFSSPLVVSRGGEHETHTACPYFTGRIIRGVTNGESPPWLQNKLRAVGLKSISTVVDITNFMTYDLGRPLHAFDADRLQGSLTIRFAKEKEELQALDGETYSLDSTMLVIADEKGPQALAGIMGGLASGCQKETTTIFLESAYFHPKTISRTGRTLGILSDARHRFERGVDPALVKMALDYATQMILELCGGEASEIIEIGQVPPLPDPLMFDTELLKTFGGLPLEHEEAVEILERLGFRCTPVEDLIRVYIPSWRTDILGPHDLVEEILRVKGYDAIPLQALPPLGPEEAFPLSPQLQARHMRQWMARRVLAARGLSEVFTWSFMKEEEARCFADISPNLILSNPISVDLSTMRPTLVGSLAKCLQKNKDRGTLPPGLFEVALDYHDTTVTGQRWVVAGIRPGYHQQRHWLKPQGMPSVYDVKADAMTLLQVFGINMEAVEWQPQGPRYYHPGQCATLMMGPQTNLGYVGTMHPLVAETLGLEGPLFMFEIFLEAVPVTRANSSAFTPLSLQPVERDLAFVVDEDVPASVLLEAVKKVDPQLIKKADIFDVYRGKGVPEGKKSIALWYCMQPQDKTLTDAQIHETMQAIIAAVEQATKGSLRQ